MNIVVRSLLVSLLAAFISRSTRQWTNKLVLLLINIAVGLIKHDLVLPGTEGEDPKEIKQEWLSDVLYEQWSPLEKIVKALGLVIASISLNNRYKIITTASIAARQPYFICIGNNNKTNKLYYVYSIILGRLLLI